MTPEQIKMLEAPLDPINVKKAPAGKYGDYIDGYHALSEANKIFGHGNWSYKITRLEMCSRTEAQDKNGNAQIRIGYLCTVRAWVGDAEREGAAVGTGMGKPENEADAHESAAKEAETDALKRALRSFGNTFGLALYDKSRANVQAVMPDADWARLVQLVEATSSNIPKLLQALKINLPNNNLQLLSAADYPRAINALETKLARMAQEQTNTQAKEAA